MTDFQIDHGGWYVDPSEHVTDLPTFPLLEHMHMSTLEVVACFDDSPFPAHRPGYYVCSRPKGHTGRHAAFGFGGTLYGVWR